MNPRMLTALRTNLGEMQPGKGKMFIYAEMGGQTILRVPKADVVDTTSKDFEAGKLDERIKQRLNDQLQTMLSRDPRGRGCAGITFTDGKKIFFRAHVRKRIKSSGLRLGLKSLKKDLRVGNLVVVTAPKQQKKPPRSSSDND